MKAVGLVLSSHHHLPSTSRHNELAHLRLNRATHTARRPALAATSKGGIPCGTPLTPVDPNRRAALLGIGSSLLLSSLPPHPAAAIRDGAPLDVEPVPGFASEDFTAEAGWTELNSGLLYRVLRPGEGNKTKGIFDRVDHFQPFPFVTVRYTAYEPSGRAFASSVAARRDYNYQAGVRQELQDEDGAVMSMVVGERRQFVVPLELAYKRKLFGQLVPQRDALLVDVELLALQPY